MSESEILELMGAANDFETVGSRQEFKFTRRDPYYIKSEDEWKEILKNHHQPYYPRFEDDDAETTFQKILGYFDGATEKPDFADEKKRPKKVVKLEKELETLQRILYNIELDSTERLQIERKIRYLNSKLLKRK